MKTIPKDILSHNFEKAQKSIKKNYNTNAVRKYLTENYYWVCCYCESKFDFSAQFDIEHFYPKWAFDKNDKPMYLDCKLELINLHYACPKCNHMKWHMCPDWKESYKKSKKGEIIWKRKDVKIYSPNFLLNWNKFKLPNYDLKDKFEYKKAEISAINDNENRWTWTINTFDLNNKSWKRLWLLENRKRYFFRAQKLSTIISDILKWTNINWDKLILIFLFTELNSMMKNTSPYSTMIKKQFWKIYLELYKRARLNP